MILQCGDLDRALHTPELMPDMRAHAENCPGCAAQLHLWEEISRVAPELHEEWESPQLWDRIRVDLAAEAKPRAPRAQWWALAAAVVVCLGLGAMYWWWAGRPMDRELLTEAAFSEVQQTESAYVKSIAKLSALAAKDLERSSSPLAAAYREKLAVLDSAIVEAKAVVDRNRYNTYLRMELASLYEQKQKTLQEWLRNANRN